MNKPIIEVKNLGKRYDITHARGGYVALRDVIANVAKNPFAFIKQKAKKVVGMEKKEEFWALDDVSFNVQKGEVIGVIGANGAGKSTLLKILSQITPPTKGEVIIRGRVGSLLEVGTGFHPELTGRENIFLNGAILGMKKREIEAKFDEIVAFAGVERFLDTPVKHFSSGMYVRLAFSVAAHMEPDILLVDEVLAVGDAEFQKKCLGKMDEITKKDGRTIFFVSHNMGAISQLCAKTIIMKKGRIAAIGQTDEVISAYISDQIRSTQALQFENDPHKKVKIRKISILGADGLPASEVNLFEPFSIRLEYDVNEKIFNAHPSIVCTDINNDWIFHSGAGDNNPAILKETDIGSYTATFHYPAKSSISLNRGTYFFRLTVEIPSTKSWDTVANIPLVVTDVDTKYQQLDGGKRKGAVLIETKWEVTKLK